MLLGYSHALSCFSVFLSQVCGDVICAGFACCLEVFLLCFVIFLHGGGEFCLGLLKCPYSIGSVGVEVAIKCVLIGLITHDCRESVEVADVVRASIGEELLLLV